MITVILKREENKLRVLWVCGNRCALAELSHRLPIALYIFCANNFCIVGPPLSWLADGGQEDWTTGVFEETVMASDIPYAYSMTGTQQQHNLFQTIIIHVISHIWQVYPVQKNPNA